MWFSSCLGQYSRSKTKFALTFAAWNLLPARGMKGKQASPIEVGKPFKFLQPAFGWVDQGLALMGVLIGGVSYLKEAHCVEKKVRGLFPIPLVLIPPRADPGAPEVRAETAASLGWWLTVRYYMLRGKANKCHPGKGSRMRGGWQTASRPPRSGGKSGGLGQLHCFQYHKDIWMVPRAKVPAHCHNCSDG